MPLQTQPAPVAGTPAPVSTNALLAGLPREVQQRLVSQGTRVTIDRDHALCDTGAPVTWAYLPVSGLVSLQTMIEDGGTVELAMIGTEGLVGGPLLANATAPYTAEVVMPGEALRLKIELLQSEFERNTALQRVLLHYWHTLNSDIAQGSACHRFHAARQRLARWLLSASDKTRSSRIYMTQERLGAALGLQRTGVTAASIALQDLGAIAARHGRITIIDRGRLETQACECYRVLSRTASPY